MKKWIIAFFMSLNIICGSCYAWNALGHMVVANIAYQNLTPSVKTKVDKMSADFAKEYPDVNSFVQMAPWPDTLHGQQIEVFSRWHYIGNAFSADGTPVKVSIDTDNAEWAIKTIEPILKNANANVFEHARFLAFFIHIVGDMHQPLHAASRVSAEFPDGDQGGNLYLIQYPAGTTMPLHALWDAGCGLFAGDASPEMITALTQSITSTYPESFFGDQVSDLDPVNWAQEDMTLAQSQVYQTPEKQVPSASYINSGKTIAAERAALAGYRLAYLLNTLLASR